MNIFFVLLVVCSFFLRSKMNNGNDKVIFLLLMYFNKLLFKNIKVNIKQEYFIIGKCVVF